jgi:hypothetical protein
MYDVWLPLFYGSQTFRCLRTMFYFKIVLSLKACRDKAAQASATQRF